MRFLLDTHAFLWWIGDDPRLSGRAAEVLSDTETRAFLSIASAWEMGIKVGLGRLELNDDLQPYLRRHLSENDIEVLGISLEHVSLVPTLPHHHRDPFDRMLVAQAMAENIPILTVDPQVAAYPVEVVW